MPDRLQPCSPQPPTPTQGVLMLKKRSAESQEVHLSELWGCRWDRRLRRRTVLALHKPVRVRAGRRGFSDAHSLTNQSDWDSPYLDMELARPSAQAQQRTGAGREGVRPPG